ncbi:MAG: sugar phosphate isomerase/epimerase [Bacteroidota bacterium]
MKRTLFATALICILLFDNQLFAQKKKGLYKAEFGVQGYTFRRQFPKGIEATLDTIKILGFTELEGGGGRGMKPEDFKKLCDNRGIKIPSVGSDFNGLKKDPMQYVTNAKIMGAEYVMCAWIPHKGNEFTLENAKEAVEVFNAAGKVFKENGLTFCYHDHGYEFHKMANSEETLMDYIIQNTNPEYVSFEMDVLWTLHGGGSDAPEKLLKKYKNRWKLMHVKDLKKGVVGDKSGHEPAENDVVLGTGQANWKKILKLANKHGIKHFFIEDESEHEMQNIPKSLAYLRSL